jgi:hypothetical protein
MSDAPRLTHAAETIAELEHAAQFHSERAAAYRDAADTMREAVEFDLAEPNDTTVLSLSGLGATGSGGTATLSPNGGGRPPLQEAAIIVLTGWEGDGMTTAQMTDELWRRRWVGGQNGKPSKESVRWALKELSKKGKVTEQLEGTGPQAAIVWRRPRQGENGG